MATAAATSASVSSDTIKVPGKYLKFYSLNEATKLKHYFSIDVIINSEPQQRAKLVFSPDKVVEPKHYYRVNQKSSGLKMEVSNILDTPTVTLYPSCKVLDSTSFHIDDDLVKKFLHSEEKSVDDIKASPVKRRRVSVCGVVKQKRIMDTRVELKIMQGESTITTKFWEKESQKTTICQEGHSYKFENVETTAYLDQPISLTSTVETVIHMIEDRQTFIGKIEAADIQDDSLEKTMTVVVKKDEEELDLIMDKEIWKISNCKIGHNYTFETCGNVIETVTIYDEMDEVKLDDGLAKENQ